MKVKTRQNKEFSGAKRYFDVVMPAAGLHYLNHSVPTAQRTDGLRYKENVGVYGNNRCLLTVTRTHTNSVWAQCGVLVQCTKRYV